VEYRFFMRKLSITLAVSATLVLAVAASAALPVTGPFAGTTSLRPINGFSDLVTFSVSGKSMKKFTFGTLGCFAVNGGFPVGTDPYGDPTATALVTGSIPVTPTGTFSFTAKPVLADPQGTVTTAVIQGSFANSKSASGTITLTQTSNGDKCGPSKMKFTAVPGTPTSLGING
jgi:hypothetical protein